jgi:short-subunit dehydrogenase
MALNYFGALRLILGLLPDMRVRKSGHIINISSAGVLFKSPRFAAYVASKAALDAFTQVAATEAYADRVHFTTVHMPLVRTPMIAPTKAYRRAPALTPEQAAELTLEALVSQKTRVTPFFAGWSAVSRALFPEGTLRVVNAIYRSTSGSSAKREVPRKGGVEPVSRAS